MNKLFRLTLALLLMLSLSGSFAFAQDDLFDEVSSDDVEEAEEAPAAEEVVEEAPAVETVDDIADIVEEESSDDSMEEAAEAPAEEETGKDVEGLESLDDLLSEDVLGGEEILGAQQLDDSELDIDAQLASGWVSTIQIINGGTSEANVSVMFYPEGSSTADATETQTIAAGNVASIKASDVAGLGTDWRGGAVVQSSEPVGVAVRQVIDGDTKFAGAYSGLSAGGSTIYMPSVLRDFYGYENIIAVQGVSGSDDTIEFTVTIYDEAGAVKDTIASTVGVNTGTYMDLSGATGSDLGNQFSGSATLTTDNGTDTVAVVVVQENPGGFTQSYEGFTSGVKTLYAGGLYDEYYEFISSINVQNVSSDCTGNVTIAYTGDSNVSKSNTFSLAPRIGKLVNQPDDDLNPGTGPNSHWSGSATITSDCDIVAIVNAATVTSNSYPYANNYNQAQTYSAVATGAKSVGVPLLEKLVDGRFSSVTVQNVGSSAATFSITYSDGTQVNGASLNVGESNEIVLNGGDTDTSGLSNGFSGGAIVTSDSDIAVVVNQGATGDALSAATGDQSISYNGSGLQ